MIRVGGKYFSILDFLAHPSGIEIIRGGWGIIN